MMNFGLDGIFACFQILRQHLDHALLMANQGRGGQIIDSAYKSVVQGNLEYVHKKCADLLLQSAEDRLVIIWNDFHIATYSWGTLALGLKPLLEQFEADLKRERFFHYSRDKSFLLIKIPGEWSATLAAFPSVSKEIEEGVDCYALDHYTACVFHMMRVAEHGLRALARERSVTFPRHPLEWADWQTILEKTEANARSATTGMPRGPKRDAMQAFYNGATGQLHGFKDTYRNVVMHVRRSYDEFDALRSINQVRDFMNGLSAKIGEQTKTPIRKWP